MPSYDVTLCLSPACKDRADCWRHWSHHQATRNPYQSFATFDGSRGRECEHFTEITEHRSAPSRNGAPQPED